MQLIFSAIMGIVQGLTEFLPVSSSGHLLVAERLLSLLGYQAGDSALTVAVMLHLGTLIAVAAIFWIDWLVRLLLPVKYSTLLLLFLASLPALAAVVGPQPALRCQ